MLCKDTVCPENIKGHWIKAVEQLLEKRAKRVIRLHAVAPLNFISLPCNIIKNAQNGYFD